MTGVAISEHQLSVCAHGSFLLVVVAKLGGSMRLTGLDLMYFAVGFGHDGCPEY
jgi:hypothetical protein